MANAEPSTKAESLQPLCELAKTFNSFVYILHVMPAAYTMPTVKEAINGVKLEHNMEGIDHSYHYTENEDVVEGIRQFIEKHNIDMMVMLARKHSLFHRMIHQSQTRKMAFHALVPLLTLQEK